MIRQPPRVGAHDMEIRWRHTRRARYPPCRPAVCILKGNPARVFGDLGMNASDTADFKDRKAQIRQQAHANRNQQPDKDELSRAICAAFMALPEYAAARTVMFYVDVRSEVR